MINANTENVDLAPDLIDFIIDPETLRALAVGASTVEGAGLDPDEMPLSHEWNENYGESPFYTIHDQGHAPFKTFFGKIGVNITMGLPIPRTSVDHGTAFDIAGQGIAQEESLLLACERAAELAPGWPRDWGAIQ